MFGQRCFVVEGNFVDFAIKRFISGSAGIKRFERMSLIRIVAASKLLERFGRIDFQIPVILSVTLSFIL